MARCSQWIVVLVLLAPSMLAADETQALESTRRSKADAPQAAVGLKKAESEQADSAQAETEQEAAIKELKRRRAALEATRKVILEAQREANKKYTEARVSAIRAKAALEAAEKQAAAAEGEEAKDLANKTVQDARKKLEEANKNVQKQRDVYRKLVVGQAAARNTLPRYSNVVGVRPQVDPQDNKERFLLLLDRGPLVIEATLTIDGVPFRTGREKLVDELLVAADTDGDGKASWTEALQTPRFTMGRVRVTNDAQRQQYLKMLDINSNNEVERVEVRRFIAQFFGGPAFTLNGGNPGYGRGGYSQAQLLAIGRVISAARGQADVQELLDADQDGALSKNEIASAEERLKSRDADDNDLLYSNEIAGTAARNRRIRSRASGRAAPLPLVGLLGPTAQPVLVFSLLRQRYQIEGDRVPASAFSGVPQLFAALDKNQDGALQQDEMLEFNRVKPHIELSVDMGGAKAKGLTLVSIDPELSPGALSAAAISLPGLTLSFSSSSSPARAVDYNRIAENYLKRYDQDANGYVEKKELPGNAVQILEMWDLDEDGKVYAKEITQSYARMQAPQTTQIRGTAVNQGNSLFQALDVSGDGRLSLREMKTAHQRIKAFDKDNDGQVSANEIPVIIAVNFAVGNIGYYGMAARTSAARPNRPTKSDAPEWFTRMDRNGDGDITLKEFLGDEEEFKRLDTNRDGFVEPKEAQAASK